MKIENLIWSRAIVTQDEAEIENQPHVQVTYNETSHLLHLYMFSSSQGCALDPALTPSLSYSYPELVRMGTAGMTLRAYTWGKKAKEKEVFIRLEF